MRRDLLRRINDAGYDLFWTVLVGHEHSMNRHGLPGQDHRWITSSASYRVSGETLELVHSLAGLYESGPELISELDWRLRDIEVPQSRQERTNPPSSSLQNASFNAARAGCGRAGE
jgi:hypothetical protein